MVGEVGDDPHNLVIRQLVWNTGLDSAVGVGRVAVEMIDPEWDAVDLGASQRQLNTVGCQLELQGGGGWLTPMCG